MSQLDVGDTTVVPCIEGSRNKGGATVDFIGNREREQRQVFMDGEMSSWEDCQSGSLWKTTTLTPIAVYKQTRPLSLPIVRRDAETLSVSRCLPLQRTSTPSPFSSSFTASAHHPSSTFSLPFFINDNSSTTSHRRRIRAGRRTRSCS
jgi:hypothetical protein